MGRVLGVDLGERRIGLALSDPNRITASPLATLQRCGDPVRDHQAIATTAVEHGVELIVVGLPTSLSGGQGPAAKAVLAEVEAMRGHVGVSVFTYDERLTTVIADRAMREGRVRRAKRREKIDQVAAAVMLQGYLEATR